MVDVLVDGPFLLSVFPDQVMGDDFDGSVRAVDFADAAAGAFVLVVFVVRHDHFAAEAFEHLQLVPVFGVLLGDDQLRAEEIIPGDLIPGSVSRHLAGLILYISRLLS